MLTTILGSGEVCGGDGPGGAGRHSRKGSDPPHRALSVTSVQIGERKTLMTVEG